MKFKYDLFISYNNRDKLAVENLSKKLEKDRYKVWLDEWEINVGDQLVQKINRGLTESRFLAVWLTKYSIASNWVEREWQTKYFYEVNSNIISILPLLGELCEIPILLQGKKYADFSKSFEQGYLSLLNAIKNNSSFLIEDCFNQLIKGDEINSAAQMLRNIVIRNEDEYAMNKLWEVAKKSNNIEIIDACAFNIGRIIIESDNTKLQELGFKIIIESIESDSEIAIDKFAYTVGEIYILAKSKSLRNEALKIISEMSLSNKQLIKERYLYTQKRITKQL